jgi:cellulose synthase/poly-beta-1,6-N-acetylglucosamine synthase-like glycosyltransferase
MSATLISLTETLLCAVAGGLALLSSLFALECILGSRSDCDQDAAASPPGQDPAVAVLIPAHNESAHIARTIESVIAQLGPESSVLVVADNCSDNTAELARRAGAQVTERFHDTHRGKGYALDHGVQHLKRSRPHDVVVMIDADCTLGPGALAALARDCRRTGRPVQGRYLMHASESSSIKLKLAEFAWLVKNQTRPCGMHAMGLPCHLTGAGMAFPSHALERVPLASGNLVEDMQLGLDLAKQGHLVTYCHDAVIHSEFPTSEHGQATQRQRWEHGHLQTILTQTPGLIGLALRRRDAGLLALALDLAIPPLTSLVIACSLMSAVGLGWALGTGSLPTLLWSLWGLLAVGVGVGLAWHRQGRHVLTARELASIGSYMAAKLPIYFGFMTRRQVSWVRTERKDGGKK